VADEIRKLAEQSAQQSLEIGKDIAQIMKEITLVVSAAGESEQAFGLILEKISVLNRYEQEIKQSMVEQNEGSRQILEAIAQINDITSHVKNNAGEITEGSRSIRTEMQNLASGSEELNTSMHRIDEGTQRIQRTSSQLEQIGHQTAEQIATLADVVSQFKL
jgi:methyl-accepting chemotaxis protein